MFDRLFHLREHQTSVPREVLAGCTTFLTMSYILVVQPSVLSTDFSGQPTGLEPGAVLLATCLASAFASALMGLLGRLPIALAPGMGQNFFFVSVTMAFAASTSPDLAWRSALAVVLVAGVLFFLLTYVGLRQFVLDVMSPSLRSAIAVGIGLFIAFIGLQNASVVSASPTLVAFNASQLLTAESGIFWGGLVVTLLLRMWNVPGSLLLGMVAAAFAAWWVGEIEVQQWVGWPVFEQSAVCQFEFRSVFSATGLSFVAVFLFMDIFDTTGTLIGVSQQAGLLKNGKLPRMREAMLSDSLGTVLGACLGTSTVTSYIESAAGVEQGGRTGLTAVTVAVLFMVALALSPLIIAVGGFPPITAPALVIVGAMMFRNVANIAWDDETEAVPSFLVILGIPLFFSIADGIALGMLAWPVLKLARGRGAEIPVASYVIAALLIAYFVAIRVSI